MVSRAMAQKRVTQIKSIPVPYGGINEAEPLAAMGEKYAIALDNLYADNLTLRVRSGYKEWVTGIGHPVDTLINYSKTDGTEELFACTNNGIYDVTSSTDAPVKVADLSFGYVIFTHFSNIAGNYLLVCNGVDPMWLYDGTAWLAFSTGTDPWGPGVISGVAPEAISYVLSYKNRLFFIEKNSLTVWYLPVDAVGGECKPFYYGSVFNRGGTLVQIFTWSLDSGEGLDDKLVAQTSAGELAIYSGTDPALAEDWALDAMFYSSPPIGPKASEDYGGDVLILCRTGLLPLSTIVKGNFQPNEEEESLSKRINRTFVLLVASQSFTPNWELHNVPSLRSVVIIIPATDSYSSIQYVMNSNTTAWSRYLIPNVKCGRVYKNKFYFGDSNGRVLTLTGTLDDVKLDGTGGDAIQSRIVTAFSYFDDPTSNKHFKLIRPIFQSKSIPTQFHRILTDFSQNFLLTWPLPVQQQLEGSLWDKAKWNVDYWEASFQDSFHPWLGADGMGFCAALNANITSTDAVQMTAFEWAFEVGGAI